MSLCVLQIQLSLGKIVDNRRYLGYVIDWGAMYAEGT